MKVYPQRERILAMIKALPPDAEGNPVVVNMAKIHAATGYAQSTIRNVLNLLVKDGTLHHIVLDDVTNPRLKHWWALAVPSDPAPEIP